MHAAKSFLSFLLKCFLGIVAVVALFFVTWGSFLGIGHLAFWLDASPKNGFALAPLGAAANAAAYAWFGIGVLIQTFLNVSMLGVLVLAVYCVGDVIFQFGKERSSHS